MLGRWRMLALLVLAAAAVGGVPAMAGGDTTAPALVSLERVTSEEVRPGELVTVGFLALDELGGSGVERVTLMYNDPLGRGVGLDSWSVPVAGAGLASTTVPGEWTNGRYTLLVAHVADRAGNASSYLADGTVAQYPTGASGPTTHGFDFATLGFTVVDGGDDVTPPVLRGIALQRPGPFAPGENVVLDVDAVDDASGIAEVQITYADPIGGGSGTGDTSQSAWWYRHPPDPSAPTTPEPTLTLRVDAAWASGEYTVIQLNLVDGARNTAIYRPGGGDDGWDFSLAEFTVTNDDPELTAPTLEHFVRRGPDPLPQGEPLAIDFAATDPSGIQTVQFTYRDPIGGYRSLDGGWQVARGRAWTRTRSAWPTGRYELVQIMLTDQAGFHVVLRPDGTADKRPPRAEGPERHDFDFAAAGFTLEPWTVLPGGLHPPPIIPAPGEFEDVGGNTHREMIDVLARTGITGGCNPEGTRYCPSGAVTRGQMATFLVRALVLPPSSEDAFVDDEGNVHEDAINRLAAAGVSVGYGRGIYRPHGVVTRAEMASFLARGFALPAAGASPFSDVGGPHTEAIDRIAGAGITRGCDTAGTLFCPAAAVRRDQMASFIARALDIEP